MLNEGIKYDHVFIIRFFFDRKNYPVFQIHFLSSISGYYKTRGNTAFLIELMSRKTEAFIIV